jgi:hypothetical protein
MAKIVQHRFGQGIATIEARIQTEALYDALKSGDFIIDIYDAGKGGVCRAPSKCEPDDLINAPYTSAPRPKGWYVSVEGETGDVVRFANDDLTTEIGTGSFAYGASVYATVAASLKCTISDTATVGSYYIGTVEGPLVTNTVGEATYKHVWVRLDKRGLGFTEINKIASAVLSGTAIAGGVGEAAIVTGGETIIITLAGDTWVAYDGTALYLIATADKLIDGLAHVAGTDDLDKIKTALKAAANATDNTAVVRTSATVITITLPAVATYSITVSEEISLEVPADLLESSVTPLASSPHITVTAAA